MYWDEWLQHVTEKVGVDDWFWWSLCFLVSLNLTCTYENVDMEHFPLITIVLHCLCIALPLYIDLIVAWLITWKHRTTNRLFIVHLFCQHKFLKNQITGNLFNIEIQTNWRKWITIPFVSICKLVLGRIALGGNGTLINTFLV